MIFQAGQSHLSDDRKKYVVLLYVYDYKGDSLFGGGAISMPVLSICFFSFISLQLLFPLILPAFWI
jgi:hypothetical protein